MSADHDLGDVHGDVSVDQTELAAELPGSDGVATTDVAEYATRLGDDALIMTQQLGWWISRAPELEEDIAIGNLALDTLGHARMLLTYAGSATGRSEDDLAYWRDEPEFLNCWLVEQPATEFNDLIARQLIFSAYQVELYRALAASSDPSLAAIAAKVDLEVAYHLDHAVQWTLRLAGGTDESRRRIIAGLEHMWPYVDELFEDDTLTARLADVVPQPSSLRAGFDRTLAAVFADAELETPSEPQAMTGGRSGRHSSLLGHLLAELQWLPRRHSADAKW